MWKAERLIPMKFYEITGQVSFLWQLSGQTGCFWCWHRLVVMWYELGLLARGMW